MRYPEVESVMSRGTRRIETKNECHTIYELGLFGNKPLTWRTYDEIIRSGWGGSVCIRGRRKLDRNKVEYNVPLENVKDTISRKFRGFPESSITFNQSMPDEHLLIQGEAMRNSMIPPFGLYLFYSELRKPMNLALEEDAHHAFGLLAKSLLQSRMTPSSYSDTEALLELYPDSVVEFSTYEIGVGGIPGRNTVIWEVRNY